MMRRMCARQHGRGADAGAGAAWDGDAGAPATRGALAGLARRDPKAPADQMADRVRSQLTAAGAEYEKYHGRHAGAGERPLDDWAKVVLVPGVGVITAFTDKRSAVTANLCYRAVLETIATRRRWIASSSFRRPTSSSSSIAAGASEVGGADRQGARRQAAAAPRGGDHRWRQRLSARPPRGGSRRKAPTSWWRTCMAICPRECGGGSRPGFRTRGFRRRGRAGGREPRCPL